MYCEKCGSKLEEGAYFCSSCGARQTEGAAPAAPPPVYSQQSNRAQAHAGSVSFGKAIQLYFKNYANFRGRASRSEYWWAFLFNFLVALVLPWIPLVGIVLVWIWCLAVFIPGLSIQVRRLHDTGKSWVYILMYLIPLAGPIIMLVFFCTASGGDNRWGPGPGSGNFHSVSYGAPPQAPAAPPKAEPVQPQETFPPAVYTQLLSESRPAPDLSACVRYMAIIRYRDDGQDHEVEVRDFPCVIGRGDTCALKINDSKISRLHAKLYVENDAVMIQDLGSSNGTQVNGAALDAPVELLSGDEIIVGVTHLSVEVRSADPV